MAAMFDIGIIGASGFTGAELLRLCAQHPELRVVVATGDSQAGTAVADLYPSLAAAYGDLVYSAWTPELVDGLDAVFLGLPHGTSQGLVGDLVDKVRLIVD
ncbi:MAG: N-acetyl-gamma-glutamyl-phosphate reductase, partial [Microthrixaceae bacterium]